jgi:hypothetical protein
MLNPSFVQTPNKVGRLFPAITNQPGNLLIPLMKLLFTQQNSFLVHNAKNVVENAGISTVLRNEYASGAAGDLAPLDTWLELWVVNDSDYAEAMKIVEAISSRNDEEEWVCEKCGERNAASFDICWNCQRERPSK